MLILMVMDILILCLKAQDPTEHMLDMIFSLIMEMILLTLIITFFNSDFQSDKARKTIDGLILMVIIKPDVVRISGQHDYIR